MDKQEGNRVANARWRHQVNIDPDDLKATLKKVSNKKIMALMSYPDFGLRNSPPFTTDLLRKWINIKQKTEIAEWMTKGKTTQIPKDPPTQRNQLETHNDDVENTNGTNQGEDLQLTD